MYFVPLQAADQVVSAVIDALPLQVTSDPERQLLDYLRDKRLLLLLDNFEHVMDAAELIGKILIEASETRVLATSQLIRSRQRALPAPRDCDRHAQRLILQAQ